MRPFVAIFAASALLLAAAGESLAQSGKGGYGPGYGAGYGQGYGGYHGHGGCGYGCGHLKQYGHHGHYSNHSYMHYLAHGYNFNNVPNLPSPAYQPGPPSPTVTYPYYTIRGPRDFLLDNPPSLGP